MHGVHGNPHQFLDYISSHFGAVHSWNVCRSWKLQKKHTKIF